MTLPLQVMTFLLIALTSLANPLPSPAAGSVEAARDTAINDRGPQSLDKHELHLRKGRLLESRGVLGDAVTEYLSAIDLDPEDLEARRRLADIYMMRGDYQRAARQYEQVILRERENPVAHWQLGRIYERSGKSRAAAEEFGKASALDPSNIQIHRDMAKLFRGMGRDENAIREYRSILKKKRGDPRAWNALIALYVHKKKYDDLTDLLKEGVRLHPDDPTAHYKLGLIHEFRKNYPGAEEEYGKAIGLKNDYAKALNAMGRLYMRTGRIEEAKRQLEAARLADPDLKEAKLLLHNIKEEFYPKPYAKKKKSRTTKKKKAVKKSRKKGKKGKKSTKKGRKGVKKKREPAVKKKQGGKKKNR